MASYNIGDIERLLRIKTHVIRYWEKEMPLIQPVKDNNGRRMYRDRDLQIFFRLKYLLYERRYTLEGAKAQLYSELSGEYQDLRGQISALRSELLNLFFFLRRETVAPDYSLAAEQGWSDSSESSSPGSSPQEGFPAEERKG